MEKVIGELAFYTRFRESFGGWDYGKRRFRAALELELELELFGGIRCFSSICDSESKEKGGNLP
jgi:hypothetical protein